MFPADIHLWVASKSISNVEMSAKQTIGKHISQSGRPMCQTLFSGLQIYILSFNPYNYSLKQVLVTSSFYR